MIEYSGRNGTIGVRPEQVAELLPQLHFLRFYDAADPGDRMSVGAGDWGLPALLNAPVKSDALQAMTDDYRQAVNEALAAVSPDWRLQDAAEAQREAVRRLLTAMIPPNATIQGKIGVGRAVATKLLHKKRPHLIPVVDTVIADFYRESRPTDIIFGSFRRDLLKNESVLLPLAETASQVAGRHVGVVRVLEMVLWLTSSNAKGYRLETFRL